MKEKLKELLKQYEQAKHSLDEIHIAKKIIAELKNAKTR